MSEMISWLLLLSILVAKKRYRRKIDAFRKKIMIPESEISECPEQKQETYL